MPICLYNSQFDPLEIYTNKNSRDWAYIRPDLDYEFPAETEL